MYLLSCLFPFYLGQTFISRKLSDLTIKEVRTTGTSVQLKLDEEVLEILGDCSQLQLRSKQHAHWVIKIKSGINGEERLRVQRI